MVHKTSSKQSYEWIGLFSAMVLRKQQFENLEIWKISIELARQFCCIAEKLEQQHIAKFSDYVNETCLRLSNFIAVISDITPKKDVIRSLTNAHLLTLEVENITMILFEQQLIDSATKESILKKIHTLDNRIIEYQQQFEENFILNNTDTLK